MRRTAAIVGIALAQLLGCAVYPSPALVLQREAAEYKVQLQRLRWRALPAEALKRIERCDAAIRLTEDRAHEGYPVVTKEARAAATLMRDTCAGAEAWAPATSDGGV